MADDFARGIDLGDATRTSQVGQCARPHRRGAENVLEARVLRFVHRDPCAAGVIGAGTPPTQYHGDRPPKLLLEGFSIGVLHHQRQQRRGAIDLAEFVNALTIPPPPRVD